MALVRGATGIRVVSFFFVEGGVHPSIKSLDIFASGLVLCAHDCLARFDHIRPPSSRYNSAALHYFFIRPTCVAS